MIAGWEQCKCCGGQGIEDIYARYGRLFAAAFHGAQMPETLTDAERAFMERRGILEHPSERRLALLRDHLRDLQFAHSQHWHSPEHQAWLDREDARATEANRNRPWYPSAAMKRAMAAEYTRLLQAGTLTPSVERDFLRVLGDGEAIGVEVERKCQ